MVGNGVSKTDWLEEANHIQNNLTDELIDGTFYQSELQKVIKPEDNLYRVEKVLKKRRRGRTKEVFVKWTGWPNKFNSWVSESSLEKIK